MSDTAGQGLVGRTALVTGASGGLGAAFADMLVSAGAAVALHYHNNEQKAIALAEFGVTVNAIAPGWTLPYDSPHPPQPKDYPQSARVPDHRPGHATEVAAIARFLVSEEAGHITGQTIAVDGGLSAVLASSS